MRSVKARREELEQVAAGIMRLPERPLNLDELCKMPEAKVSGIAGTQAILDERNESW